MSLRETFQGPEFGVDAGGWAVYNTVYGPGGVEMKPGHRPSPGP